MSWRWPIGAYWQKTWMGLENKYKISSDGVLLHMLLFWKNLWGLRPSRASPGWTSITNLTYTWYICILMIIVDCIKNFKIKIINTKESAARNVIEIELYIELFRYKKSNKRVRDRHTQSCKIELCCFVEHFTPYI